MMRGEMIHDSSGAKRKEEAVFSISKGSVDDSSGILKGAFRLPGGNIIPVHGSRVTQGGMSGIKGGLVVEECRQSP